jgi:excisionase family DNA binding protein
MASAEATEILEPTRADIDAARQSNASLTQIVESLEEGSTQDAIRLPELGRLDLPVLAIRALAKIVQEIAAGNAVAVHPVERNDLTTSEAAHLLGMSRPTLINLLEQGQIPYRMVGTHRRIRRSAVLAYRETMERGDPRPESLSREERLRGLQEMAELTDRLGLGY